jgi:hypothetical protein
MKELFFAIIAVSVAVFVAGCAGGGGGGGPFQPAAIDCGTIAASGSSDPATSCFNAAASNCTPAKIKMDTRFLDPSASISGALMMSAEIKGGTTAACTFYEKVDDIIPPAGATAQEIQQFTVMAGMMKGKDFTCTLLSSEISPSTAFPGSSSMLSSTEMCQRCTGSLIDLFRTMGSCPQGGGGEPIKINYTTTKLAVVSCNAAADAITIRSESGVTLTNLDFSVLYYPYLGEEVLCANAYRTNSIIPAETKQLTPIAPCDLKAGEPYLLRSGQGIPDVSFTCAGTSQTTQPSLTACRAAAAQCSVTKQTTSYYDCTESCDKACKSSIGLPIVKNIDACYEGDSANVDEEPAVVPTNNLVGYWKFDEGTGTMAADSSIYGNDGEIYGATWVNGKSGKALHFDGSSYVRIHNSPELNPTKGMTIELWYKPDSFVGAGNSPLIDKPVSGSYGYPYRQYQLSACGDLYTVGSCKAGFGAGFTIDGTLEEAGMGWDAWEAGEWYQLKATFDDEQVSLYVNGELVGTKYAPGKITTYDSDLYIGDYGKVDAEGVSGIIDEVKIYDYTA